MLCQCLTLAQAAVVHITQTRLVLHLGARVLHQVAVVTALHDRPILHQRAVVLHLRTSLLHLRPCHLGLRSAGCHIGTRLLRRWSGDIACDWRAHLWPRTRSWASGVVLWPRTRSWASGVVLWPRTRGWASGLVLWPCTRGWTSDDRTIIAPTVFVTIAPAIVIPTVVVTVVVPAVFVTVVPTVAVVIVPMARAVRWVIAYGLVATPLFQLVAIQIAVARIGMDAIRAIENRAVIARAA